MKFSLIILLALIGFAFCQEIEKTAAEDTLKDTLKIVPKTKDTVYIAKSEPEKIGTYTEGIIKGRIYGTAYAKEKNYTNTSCLLTSLLGVIGAGACYLHADQDICMLCCPFPEKYTFEYQLGYQEGFNDAYKSIKKKQACTGIQMGGIFLVVSTTILILIIQ